MKEPALFLDRDGVITVEKGYVTDPDDLELIEGSTEAICRFNELGIKVFIVTNQSAIARGFMTLERYYEIEKKLDQMLAEQNAIITKTYFSPYHKDGVVPDYSIDHISRKPNPGMIFQALEEYKIDLKESWMVGDNISDYWTAANADLKCFFLTKTGLGRKFYDEFHRNTEKSIFFYIIDNLGSINESRITPTHII